MANAVNFSSLNSVSTIGNYDQILIRVDNSLSGAAGFGRINATTVLHTVNLATITTPTYTLALSDRGKVLTDVYNFNTTIFVPTNAAVPFNVGDQVILMQDNKDTTNYTTVTGSPGVTIYSYTSSLSLAGNYAAGTLIKKETDSWYLIGNLL